MSESAEREEQVSRIHRMVAETEKFVREGLKLNAEAAKLSEEQLKLAQERVKLQAEAAKLDRDRRLSVWVAIVLVSGSVSAVISGAIAALRAMGNGP